MLSYNYQNNTTYTNRRWGKKIHKGISLKALSQTLQVHTHTNTHTQTHTHTNTHTKVHTHIHAHTYMHTHTIYAQMHTHTWTQMHT